MPESEEDELLAELVRAWVEVYKKSATTLVLLRLVAEAGEVDTPTIADTLSQRTGWENTERGLYRTLRRLRGLGLLSVREQPGQRTGASRHLYGLTDRGARYLHGVENALID